MTICYNDLIVLYVGAVYCVDIHLNVLLCSVRSLDGVVSVVTVLWAGQQWYCCLVSGRTNDFFFFTKAFTSIQHPIH